MKNKPCQVTLFPSNSGQIRYFVKDKDSFTGSIENVVSTDHCVVLGSKSTCNVNRTFNRSFSILPY